MRAGKVQASLHIRAVSPEPPLLAHTGSESRGTFRQKAPLNGWACAVKICNDGMLEDTNSLDAAQLIVSLSDIILLEVFFHFKVYVCKHSSCNHNFVSFYCALFLEREVTYIDQI